MRLEVAMIFTPGPTAIHPAARDEAAAAFADGFVSESHRSARFRAEVERAGEALRALLGVPADHRILYTGSASEAMERIAAGAVRRRSMHLVNGAFARRFHRVASELGKEAEARTVPEGESFAAEIDLPGDAELLALTQNETSTGARIPPERVHRLAERARGAGALVAVDLVTGWPTEAVDPGRIDAGFLSVQKAFGLPAGLGVMTASPALVERARAIKAEGGVVGGHFNLPALADAADRNETVATPNMLAIRMLRRVAEEYLADGIAALRAETDAKARGLWEVLEGGAAGLRPFVGDAEIRSRTIVVVEVDPRARPGGARALREALSSRGMVVGGGYGPWKEAHLRIANFPVQTPRMMELLGDALRAEEEGARGRREP